jgi:hypothetical protein
MYYGVYAGEGVAVEEFQAKGRGIVVVNLKKRVNIALAAFALLSMKN